MEDQAVSGVVGRNAYRYPISQNDANMEFAHSARELGRNPLPIGKLYGEISTSKYISNYAFYLCKIVSSQTMILFLRSLITPILEEL